MRAPLRRVEIGEGGTHRDAEGRWPEVSGLEPDGALLVRPDGHIGWRARTGDGPVETILCQTLERILGLV